MTSPRSKNSNEPVESKDSSAVSSPRSPAAPVLESKELSVSELAFYDDIKRDLHKYCVELKEAIDKKDGKYFNVTGRYGQVYNTDAKTDSKSREDFLEEKNFDEFFKELMESAVALINKKKDIKYMYQRMTAPVERFQKCFNGLDDAGFYNAKGRPLTFWTGKEGQKKAISLQNSLCDSDVFSISIVSKLGCLLKDKSKFPDLPEELQNKYRAFSDTVFAVGSALLAAQSVGTTYIYNASASIKEKNKNILDFANFNGFFELSHIQLGMDKERWQGEPWQERLMYAKWDPEAQTWGELMDISDMRKQPMDIAMERRKSIEGPEPLQRSTSNSAFIIQKVIGARDRSRTRLESRKSSDSIESRESRNSDSNSDAPTPRTSVSSPVALPASPERVRGRKLHTQGSSLDLRPSPSSPVAKSKSPLPRTSSMDFDSKTGAEPPFLSLANDSPILGNRMLTPRGGVVPEPNEAIPPLPDEVVGDKAPKIKK